MVASNLFNLSARLSIQNQVDNLRPVIYQLQKQLQEAATVRIKIDDRFSTAKIQAQMQALQTQSTKTTTSLSTIASQSKQTSDAVSSMGNSVELAGKRFISYSIGAGVLLKSFQVIKAGVANVIEYDAALGKLAQVQESSVASTKSLGDEIRKTAVAFGVSSAEILSVTTDLAQAGIPIKEITSSLGTLARLRLNSQVDNFKVVSDSFIVMSRVFGLNSAEIEKHFGDIISSSKKFASEVPDSLVGISRLGSIWKATGGDLSSLVSTLTSLRDRTRLPIETLATGLRNLLTRISSQPETITALKNLGVELVDVNSKFIGPIESFKKINELISSLPDQSSKKLAILQQLGGTRGVNTVSALFDSLSTNLGILNGFQEKNNAITEDSFRAMDTLANKVEKAKQSFYDFFQTLSNDNSLGGFLKTTLELSSSLLQLGKNLSPIAGIAATIGVGALASKVGFSPLAASKSPIIRPQTTSTSFIRLGGESPTGFGGGIQRATGLQSIEAIKIAGQGQAELTRLNLLRITSEKQIGAILSTQGNVVQRAFGKVEIAAIKAATSLEANFPSAVAAGRGVKNAIGRIGLGRGLAVGAGVGILASEYAGNSPAASAIGAGASTGLLLGALGLTPLGAAAIATTVALKSFGDSVEASKNQLIESRLIEGKNAVAESISRGGALSPESQKSFEGLFSRLEQSRSDSLKQATFGEGLNQAVGSLLHGRLSSVSEGRDEVNANRRKALTDSRSALLPELKQLQESIAGTVKNFDEFKKFGGGIGSKLAVAMDLLDDSVLNNSSGFEENTKKLIANNVATTKVNDALKQVATQAVLSSLAIDKIQSAIIAPSKIVSPLNPASALPSYAGLNNLSSSQFGEAANRLPIGAGEKSLLSQVSAASSALPNIIATKGPSSTATTFRDDILGEVKAQNLGQQISDAVEAELSKLSFDKFEDDLSDVNAIAKKLLGAFNPLVDSARNLANNLEQASGKQLEQIGDVAAQRERVGVGRRDASIAQLDLLNQKRFFEKKGTLVGGNENIVKSQAELLSGGSSDVNTLSATLKELTTEFEKTKDARIGIQIQQTGKALQILSSSSERLKDAQQRLTEVETSRTAKLGLLETYFSADRTGRRQIAKEDNAAQLAVNRGSLIGLTILQQQNALKGLSNKGGIENAFGTGKTGNQLKDAILEATGGKGFLGAENRERGDLQTRIIQTMEDSAKATSALATFERDLFQNFIGQLSAENHLFINGLGKALGHDVALQPAAHFDLPQAPQQQRNNNANNGNNGNNAPRGNGGGPLGVRGLFDTESPAIVLSKGQQRHRDIQNATQARIAARKSDFVRRANIALPIEHVARATKPPRLHPHPTSEDLKVVGRTPVDATPALIRTGENLAKIPTKIDLDGKHTLSVQITGMGGGGDAFNKAIGDFVVGKITEQLRKVLPAEQLMGDK